MHSLTTLDIVSRRIRRLSVVVLLIPLAVASSFGCNGDELLKNNGSYCTPPAESRTEDCFLDEPKDKKFRPGMISIVDKGDLEKICDATCDKIEELFVSNVDGLKDLRALNGIEVTRSASISRNPDLRTTKGLKLQDAAGLSVEGNSALREIYGLTGLSRISWVRISNNSRVNKIHGLSEIERVHNSREGEVVNSRFTIYDGKFRNLDVLDGLKLTRRATFRLQNLDDLKRLPSVKGVASWVSVKDNKSLRDISGLTGLDKIITRLEIENNPNVKTCRAREIATQFEYGEQRSDYRIGENGSGSCE